VGWDSAGAASLLGVRLGMGCDAAMKVLGETKYRFGHGKRRLFGYEALDHAMDVDVQCSADAVVSVAVRRVLPKSKRATTWEARLLAAADAGALLDAALGPAALTRDGAQGERTRYDCAPGGGVAAWHLSAPGGALRQALLITPDLLPPDVRGALRCGAP
jgi:hypothetical protein